MGERKTANIFGELLVGTAQVIYHSFKTHVVFSVQLESFRIMQFDDFKQWLAIHIIKLFQR